MGGDWCTCVCVDEGVWGRKQDGDGKERQNHRKRELGKTEKGKGDMERYRNGIENSWRMGQRKMDQKKRERGEEGRGSREKEEKE